MLGACEYMFPDDEDAYCDELVDRILATIIPAGREYMPHGRNYGSLYDDGKTPLFTYYREMINGALRDVRRGGVAYLYKEEHLKDFLKYEPNVCVAMRDGVFYITRGTEA